VRPAQLFGVDRPEVTGGDLHASPHRVDRIRVTSRCLVVGSGAATPLRRCVDLGVDLDAFLGRSVPPAERENPALAGLSLDGATRARTWDIRFWRFQPDFFGMRLRPPCRLPEPGLSCSGEAEFVLPLGGALPECCLIYGRHEGGADRPVRSARTAPAFGAGPPCLAPAS
jgi:hypothetical protein